MCNRLVSKLGHFHFPNCNRIGIHDENILHKCNDKIDGDDNMLFTHTGFYRVNYDNITWTNIGKVLRASPKQFHVLNRAQVRHLFAVLLRSCSRVINFDLDCR